MKEALVIGVSNGIGLAIAIELQKKGYFVNIVDKVRNNLFDNYSTIRFCQVNLLGWVLHLQDKWRKALFWLHFVGK